MRGEQLTIFTAACLSCGWVGDDGTRAAAEHEIKMHERGERHPWHLAPGQVPGWEGEPRNRPSTSR
jgi:hypothetical protein